MIPIVKDHKNRILSGSVIIEGVEHLVQDYFIKCNAGLNARAWNVTERVKSCPKCFNKPIKKRSMFGEQLKMF